MTKPAAQGSSISQRGLAAADRSQRRADTTNQSAISTADIGTNTEPIRVRKFS